MKIQTINDTWTNHPKQNDSADALHPVVINFSLQQSLTNMEYIIRKLIWRVSPCPRSRQTTYVKTDRRVPILVLTICVRTIELMTHLRISRSLTTHEECVNHVDHSTKLFRQLGQKRWNWKMPCVIMNQDEERSKERDNENTVTGPKMTNRRTSVRNTLDEVHGSNPVNNIFSLISSRCPWSTPCNTKSARILFLWNWVFTWTWSTQCRSAVSIKRRTSVYDFTNQVIGFLFYPLSLHTALSVLLQTPHAKENKTSAEHSFSWMNFHIILTANSDETVIQKGRSDNQDTRHSAHLRHARQEKTISRYNHSARRPGRVAELTSLDDSPCRSNGHNGPTRPSQESLLRECAILHVWSSSQTQHHQRRTSQTLSS